MGDAPEDTGKAKPDQPIEAEDNTLRQIDQSTTTSASANRSSAGRMERVDGGGCGSRGRIRRSVTEEPTSVSTVKLIALIELHSVIWDPSHDGHRSLRMKSRAWLEVALGMYENWDDFSEAEQCFKMKCLKRKWKLIREVALKNLSLRASALSPNSLRLLLEALDRCSENEYSESTNSGSRSENRPGSSSSWVTISEHSSPSSDSRRMQLSDGTPLQPEYLDGLRSPPLSPYRHPGPSFLNPGQMSSHETPFHETLQHLALVQPQVLSHPESFPSTSTHPEPTVPSRPSSSDDQSVVPESPPFDE